VIANTRTATGIPESLRGALDMTRVEFEQEARLAMAATLFETEAIARMLHPVPGSVKPPRLVQRHDGRGARVDGS